MQIKYGLIWFMKQDYQTILNDMSLMNLIETLVEYPLSTVWVNMVYETRLSNHIIKLVKLMNLIEILETNY